MAAQQQLLRLEPHEPPTAPPSPLLDVTVALAAGRCTLRRHRTSDTGRGSPPRVGSEEGLSAAQQSGTPRRSSRRQPPSSRRAAAVFPTRRLRGVSEEEGGLLTILAARLVDDEVGEPALDRLRREDGRRERRVERPHLQDTSGTRH